MSKVATPIRHQSLIGTVGSYVLDPCATESRVTIATSKLASAIECNFKCAKIDVRLMWCCVCFIEGLYRINSTLVYTVANCVATHVFDLPAVFTTLGTVAQLHVQSIYFLFYCIVYSTRISFDFFRINAVCRRVMTTGSLS